MTEVKKQSFTGIKIVKFDSRKTKDTEKLRIVLEADVDDLGCGEYDVGSLLGSLQHHQSSDTDVGFSLFINSK